MLALGARGVMIGRAWAYALGAQGEAGGGKKLSIIASELRTAMGLTGTRRIAEVGSSLIAEGSG